MISNISQRLCEIQSQRYTINDTYPKISLSLDVLREVGERLGVDEVLLVVVAVMSVIVIGGDGGVARLPAGPVLVDRRGSVGVGVEVDVGALHLKSFGIIHLSDAVCRANYQSKFLLSREWQFRLEH